MKKHEQQTSRSEKISDFFGNNNFLKLNLYRSCFRLSLFACLFLALIEVGAKPEQWQVIDVMRFNFSDWYEFNGVQNYQEGKRYISLQRMDGIPVLQVKNPDGKAWAAQMMDIALNQKQSAPIRFSGDIKIVEAGEILPDTLITIVLVVFYQDGSHQNMVLPSVTAEDIGKWVHRTYTFTPSQPVKSVNFYEINGAKQAIVLYRNLEVAAPVANDTSLPTETVVLKGTNSSLELELRNGTICLGRLESADSNANVFLQGKDRNLWSIRLKDMTSRKVIFVEGGGHCRFKSFPERIEMYWDDIEVEGVKKALSVKAIVHTSPDTDMYQWSLEAQVAGSAPFALWEVEYPIIKDIVYRIPAEESFLFYPQDTGRVQVAPQLNLSGKRLMYGTWYMSMQFFYFYGPKNGFYVQIADGQHYSKRVEIERNNLNFDHFSLLVMQFPENMGFTKSYISPYAVSTGFLSGDWFDAARYYRKWALEQDFTKVPLLAEQTQLGFLTGPSLWMQLGPLDGRTYSPEWLALTEEAVKTQNFDMFSRLSQEKLTTMVSLDEKVLNDAIMKQRSYFDAPLYFWSGTFVQHFGVGQPFATMTIPGLSNLMKARLDDGINYIPWLSSRLFDMGTPRWERDQAEQYAIMDSSGRPVHASSSTVMCGAMDMATDYWPQALTDTTFRLMRDGYSGIYYDELASSGAEMCFSTTHGHLPGGGNYPLASRRKFLRQLKDTVSIQYPHFFTMGEEMCESFVGLCDVSWLFGSRFFNDVPAYQVVYHERSYMIGVPDGKYLDPWMARQYIDGSVQTDQEVAKTYVVKNLVNGLGLGVFRYDLTTFSPAFAGYLKEWLRLIGDAKQYLIYGEMLRTPEFAEPLPRYSMCWDRTHLVDYPVIMSSFWRSADGTVGLVLANLSEQVQIAEPLPDFNQAGLGNQPLQGIDVSSLKKVYQGIPGKDLLRIKLKGNEARVIAFSPCIDEASAQSDELPDYTVHFDHTLYGKAFGDSGEAVFYLRNLSPEALPVTIKIDGKKRQSLTSYITLLNTQEVRETRIALTLPFEGEPVQTLDLSVNVAGEETAQHFAFISRKPLLTEALKEYSVASVTDNSIVVDADLSDWPENIPTITDLAYYSATQSRIKDRNTTTAALAWTEDGLYFYCKTRDEQHYDPTEEPDHFWRGDVLQLSFNVLMTDQGSYQLIRFGLGMVRGAPQIICWDGAQFARSSKLAVKRDGNDTIYEAFFPKYMFWGMEKNKVIRFTFTVNENDGKAFTGWGEWTPGIMYTERQDEFGKLILQ